MGTWTHLSVWVLYLVSLKSCLADDQEYRLIRYLMSNYDPAVRPSLSAAQPVAVAFRLSLLALLALDERRGVLSSSCRITQKWNDVHLRWNASDFGGVSTVRIPAAQIWRPDILLRNNADPSSSATMTEAHAVLRSSGDVSWTTQALLKSACTIDLRFFPFDVHLCYLNFTSWSYDSKQLTVSADSIDLSSLHPNGEFHLEEALASSGGGRALAFSLVLRRRPGPHLIRQVLPTFLVSGLSALCFLVPPASAERVTLAIGCLLGLLLVFVAAGGGPKTNSAQLPLLGLYQICSLCLVSSAAFLSALTLGLHSKGADGIPPPPWLRKCILGCLAPVLFVYPCPPRKGALRFQESDEEDRRRGKRHATSTGGATAGGGGGGGGPPIERYSSSPQLLRRRSGGGGGGGERSSDEFERRFLRVLDRVHETLERNEARDLELEGKEAAREEWKKIAQVTDRLLLFLFLIGALLSATLLFVFAPL